jgi:antagonist of KipI
MPLHPPPRHVTPLGDQAVTLSWPDVLNAELPALQLSARRALEAAELVGLRAVVPGFETLSVHYDPRLWRFDEFCSWARDACALAPAVSIAEAPLVEIPVCYDPALGIDLGDVAAHCGLSYEEVIALHSGVEYTVRMIGFAPGFPYLAGLPQELHTPRLATPRLKVPRGTVAIGGAQTGIYSVDSPGGWRLIGQTPVELFDASRERPSLLGAGDRVKFKPISRAEYEACSKAMLNFSLPGVSVLGAMPTALGGHVNDEIAPDSCPPRAVGMAPARSGRGTPATIRVLRGSAGMTVQERRRWNWLASGVPVSGAIDCAAQRVANLLVANEPDDAVLEVSLAFGELEFVREALIAVTGADLGAAVDGNPLPLGRPVAVRAGAKLSFGSARIGCRAYLAVAGGIDTPEVLGSRSTDVRSQLGGVLGRALAAGDELPVGEPSELVVRVMQRLASEAALGAPRWFVPLEGLGSIDEPTIRFLRGAQFEWLTAESQLALVTELFSILPASDRTGLRLGRPGLGGPSLTYSTQRELASTGVAVGTIQLPASGDPIVLLNDGPPTGGYAQIAHVIGVDLSKLAQVRPGRAVRLQEVSIAEVERLRGSKWREEIEQEIGIGLALQELVR